MADLSESDARTWVFEVGGFHLDAPQKAKSRVAEENDTEYHDLRARTIGGFVGKTYVVVVGT